MKNEKLVLFQLSRSSREFADSTKKSVKCYGCHQYPETLTFRQGVINQDVIEMNDRFITEVYRQIIGNSVAIFLLACSFKNKHQ